MITKRIGGSDAGIVSLILAKIYMVTKQRSTVWCYTGSLILAKIYMVTKQGNNLLIYAISLILAKIHMVTKQPPA